MYNWKKCWIRGVQRLKALSMVYYKDTWLVSNDHYSYLYFYYGHDKDGNMVDVNKFMKYLHHCDVKAVEKGRYK